LPPLSTGSMWFLTELDYCGRKTFPIYAIWILQLNMFKRGVINKFKTFLIRANFKFGPQKNKWQIFFRKSDSIQCKSKYFYPYNTVQLKEYPLQQNILVIAVPFYSFNFY
jgi:hypothetical protein